MKNPKNMRMSNPNVPFLAKNIDHAADLGLSMFKPGCHADAPGAVICGTGPTLLKPMGNLNRVRKLAKAGYIIFAVKEAVKLLTDEGIKVHYSVAMDPDRKQIAKTPIVPGVTYLLASSCHPEMFKHVMDGGVEVKIFHSACGAENEIARYHHLFGDTTVAEGGYTVVNRAFAVARIAGIRPAETYIAGAPFGWREDEEYYAKGVTGKPGNATGPTWDDHGKIDGKRWFTKLDLMTSAQDLAKRIKAGECKVIGDSLPLSLSKHPLEYIEAITTREKQARPRRRDDTRYRFQVEENYDVRLVRERLEPARLSLDESSYDVILMPPRWVPEGPAQNPGG